MHTKQQKGEEKYIFLLLLPWEEQNFFVQGGVRCGQFRTHLDSATAPVVVVVVAAAVAAFPPPVLPRTRTSDGCSPLAVAGPATDTSPAGRGP